MSVGSADVTVTPTYDTKKLVFSGDTVWFRNLITLTVATATGAPGSLANCVFLVYRGSTLVALAQTPTGAVFSLDTNTAEMEDYFPDTVDIGSPRDFQVYFYNTDPTSLELLGKGILEVLGTRDYGTVLIAPIPPLSASTVFIGSFAFYNGKTYLRSVTDSLYYQFAAYGEGAGVSNVIDTTGITIPGSP